MPLANDAALTALTAEGAIVSQDVAATDEQSTGAEDPRVGQLIQRKYRLTRKLSAGEMGDLYAAQHLIAKKSIAVKVFHPGLSQHPEFADGMRELMNVVRALAKNAPEIVTVYDCDVAEDGSVFVAMELVGGSSLAELLRVEHPLKIERAVRLAGQIAGALGTAHMFGVVHGDIRPGNIIITNGEPAIKLVGFERARLRDVAPAALLERSGALKAHDEYRSPEQIRDEEVTPLADVYGLGVLFYEMLTGRLPFSASTASALKTMHLSKPPAPLRELRSDIPEVVEGKVLHALEKDPERRQNHIKDVANEYLYDTALYFETARQEVDAVEADGFVEEDEDEQAAAARPRAWRRVAVLAGLAILLTIAGLWALTAWRDSETPEPPVPSPVALPPMPAPVAPVTAAPPLSAPEASSPSAVQADAPTPVPKQPTEAKPGGGTEKSARGTAKVAKKTPRPAPPPTGSVSVPQSPRPEPAAQPSTESQADPGAVIDWLLKRPGGGSR